MGRHASARQDRRLDPRLAIAAAVVLLLVAGGLAWWVVGKPDAAAAGCDSPTDVRVTVAPELESVAKVVLERPVRFGDDGCAVADVRAERPLQTVSELEALQGSSLPDVWVPDSSLWLVRVEATPLTSVRSMATSPMVMVTSRPAADELGWTARPPSWGEGVQVLLAAGHTFAVGDIGSSAREMAAATAVSGSLGGGSEADDEVLQALLALGRNPGNSIPEATKAGVEGDPAAPAFPATEQDVITAAAQNEDSALVAVYPSDGSPGLDYPVVRVGEPDRARRAAVDAVIAALTSATARDQVLAAGFRADDGTAPRDAGEATGTRPEAPEALPVDGTQAEQLSAHVASLAEPARLLMVVDVSASMDARAGGGTRIELARDAAKSALTLLPNSHSVGLWAFAYHMDGDRDHVEQLPLRALDADVSGTSQRAALDERLDALPDQLTPGGTGLHDTVLAAVRASREAYQPGSISRVVLLTDGADDDDAAAISLPGLLDTLAGEADPARPVEVIAVAIGPDADQDELKAIAEATGGQAYSARNPADLGTVLFDALRQRG